MNRNIDFERVGSNCQTAYLHMAGAMCSLRWLSQL